LELEDGDKTAWSRGTPELLRRRIQKCEILTGLGSLLLLVTLFAGPAFGATLVWDSVQGAQGYRVYWGTSKGNYPNKVDVGAATQYPVDSLPLADKTVYYITVTAYNAAGESGYATPVVYSPGDNTPPLPPTGLSVE
jgi:hypothetical protein